MRIKPLVFGTNAEAQGQLIAFNPNNGAIEAVVGGYNFYQSKFNRTIQGWRQPGSTIKPFVYALANAA